MLNTYDLRQYTSSCGEPNCQLLRCDWIVAFFWGLWNRGCDLCTEAKDGLAVDTHPAGLGHETIQAHSSVLEILQRPPAIALYDSGTRTPHRGVGDRPAVFWAVLSECRLRIASLRQPVLHRSLCICTFGRHTLAHDGGSRQDRGKAGPRRDQ